MENDYQIDSTQKFRFQELIIQKHTSIEAVRVEILFLVLCSSLNLYFSGFSGYSFSTIRLIM